MSVWRGEDNNCQCGGEKINSRCQCGGEKMTDVVMINWRRFLTWFARLLHLD